MLLSTIGWGKGGRSPETWR